MAYAAYVNHPESQSRKEADFTLWRFWSAENAPWTGVGIDEMAALIQSVCTEGRPADICEILDQGGDLSPEATRAVLRQAEAVMAPKLLEVFRMAVDGGYGVRVTFTAALGQAMSASAYLAKFGSA